MRSLFFGNAAQRKGIRSTVITALNEKTYEVETPALHTLSSAL